VGVLLLLLAPAPEELVPADVVLPEAAELTLIELALMLPFLDLLPSTTTVVPGRMLLAFVLTVFVTFDPAAALTLTVLPWLSVT
jgi:hypothetical protein